MRDDDQEAERLVNALRRRVEAAEDPFFSMEAALLSGRAKWGRSKKAKSSTAKDRLLKTALERAKEAALLGERRGYATGQMMGLALQGELLCEIGDPNSALPFSQRAAEMADDRLSTSLPVESIHLSYAKVLLCLGDRDEARTVLFQAMKSLRHRSERLPPDSQKRFWNLVTRKELRDVHDMFFTTCFSRHVFHDMFFTTCFSRHVFHDMFFTTCFSR
ncbi:MAG: hypothetical protein GY822_22395, partial [Deltaproteobacteria bacterium]|nr:hypothetical protein [Deltaproteobacteria bacterium]